jgi:hypothetical protein
MSRFSLNSFAAWIKSRLNKWRLAFLVFAVIYAFFTLLDLSFMAIQWDEITHLNEALFF